MNKKMDKNESFRTRTMRSSSIKEGCTSEKSPVTAKHLMKKHLLAKMHSDKAANTPAKRREELDTPILPVTVVPPDSISYTGKVIHQIGGFQIVEASFFPKRLDAKKIITPNQVIIDGRESTAYIQKITLPGTNDVVSKIIHFIPKDTRKMHAELEADPNNTDLKDPIRLVDLSGKEWSYMRIRGKWDRIRPNHPTFNVNRPRVLRDAMREHEQCRNAENRPTDQTANKQEQKTARCKCTDF